MEKVIKPMRRGRALFEVRRSYGPWGHARRIDYMRLNGLSAPCCLGIYTPAGEWALLGNGATWERALGEAQRFRGRNIRAETLIIRSKAVKTPGGLLGMFARLAKVIMAFLDRRK